MAVYACLPLEVDSHPQYSADVYGYIRTDVHTYIQIVLQTHTFVCNIGHVTCDIAHIAL